MKTLKEILEASHTNPIILFDGVCIFCNSWVNFLIRRDDDKVFRYAPIQSKTGQMICSELNLNLKSISSVVLIKREKVYTKSEVIFELIEYLTPLYRPFLIFRILPLSLRNRVYDFIASIRYKVFGKKEKCEIPDKNILDLYLDY